MTQDDILRMAREAGSIDSEDVIETVWAAFTAAEREACAQVCEKVDLNTRIEDSELAIVCAESIRARGKKT